MGPVYVNVGLSNPADPGRTESASVMVDTGATLSVLPTSLLEELGIQRIGQRGFRGFGGRLTRDVGSVNVHYGGEVAGTTAVFGVEGDPSVLGVTALETLGFNVDPTSGQLHRVDLLI